MRTTLIRRPQWHGLDRADPFHRLLGDFFGEQTAPAQNWTPAIDVREEKDGVVTVRADLPGVEPKDIKVAVEENILTIEGERTEKREKNNGEEKTHWVERFTGSFRRSVRLPAHVDGDAIKARYSRGVLEIACPLKPEARPRQIEVTTN